MYIEYRISKIFSFPTRILFLFHNFWLPFCLKYPWTLWFSLFLLGSFRILTFEQIEIFVTVKQMMRRSNLSFFCEEKKNSTVLDTLTRSNNYPSRRGFVPIILANCQKHLTLPMQLEYPQVSCLNSLFPSLAMEEGKSRQQAALSYTVSNSRTIIRKRQPKIG